MKKIGLIAILGLAVILPASGSNRHNGDIDFSGLLSHSLEYCQPDDDSPDNPVYTCSMHPEVVRDKPGKCPKCGMKLIQKETVKDHYSCPMHSEVMEDKPGKCPKCGMNLTKKEIMKDQYTCPMHADVVSDKAGKCPKCGMNLVLKTTEKKNAAEKKQ